MRAKGWVKFAEKAAAGLPALWQPQLGYLAAVRVRAGCGSVPAGMGCAGRELRHGQSSPAAVRSTCLTLPPDCCACSGAAGQAACALAAHLSGRPSSWHGGSSMCTAQPAKRARMPPTQLHSAHAYR